MVPVNKTAPRIFIQSDFVNLDTFALFKFWQGWDSFIFFEWLIFYNLNITQNYILRTREY